MSLKSEFKFGEWVEVTGALSRHHDIENKRFWAETIYGHSFPLKVLFLGARMLVNGKVTHDYEDGAIFEPEEYIKGALVCPPSGKPFKVLLTQVRKIQ